jgi:hypothetical protein
MLGALALAACGAEPIGNEGSGNLRKVEAISGEMMATHFATVDDLHAFLKNRNIQYLFVPEDEPVLIVEPTLCASKVGDIFKFFHLRIEGTSGPKIYRYRVYESDSNPLCLEEDFGFKNPYQS